MFEFDLPTLLRGEGRVTLKGGNAFSVVVVDIVVVVLRVVVVVVVVFGGPHVRSKMVKSTLLFTRCKNICDFDHILCSESD